jgi:hypothetical protein
MSSQRQARRHIKLAIDNTYEGFVRPQDLSSVLNPTQTHLITFRGQSSMESYRRMLYTINKQGEFRYRTLRAENEMWGLLIWRMK